MGIRDFSLTSENGVITPSWRTVGIKNDTTIRSKKNYSYELCYVSLAQFNFIRINISKKKRGYMESSDEFIDNIYLTYDKILLRLKLLGIKTKNGKEITHSDLRQAVLIM